jgi:hypothetical protein
MPNVLRLFGILFLFGAVVVAILNLHRVADLGLPWSVPLLLILDVVCTTLSRKGKGKRLFCAPLATSGFRFEVQQNVLA